jgi:hypothetical protein
MVNTDLISRRGRSADVEDADVERVVQPPHARLRAATRVLGRSHGYLAIPRFRRMRRERRRASNSELSRLIRDPEFRSYARLLVAQGLKHLAQALKHKDVINIPLLRTRARDWAIGDVPRES